jgi:hypothetical protein
MFPSWFQDVATSIQATSHPTLHQTPTSGFKTHMLVEIGHANLLTDLISNLRAKDNFYLGRFHLSYWKQTLSIMASNCLRLSETSECNYLLIIIAASLIWFSQHAHRSTSTSPFPIATCSLMEVPVVGGSTSSSTVIGDLESLQGSAAADALNRWHDMLGTRRCLPSQNPIDVHS